MSPVDAGPKSPVRPGARLGPYEVEAEIGAGGMGVVYRARDSRLGRTVAIKVLPPGLAGDPERRRRFEREARAVAALEHPHICVLHDIGSENGIDFLVMEHLTGETLARRLKKGRLRRAEVLPLAVQIAEALGAAHAQGIVHRDLKPANVMLTPSGVKLLDFGLAKLRSSDRWAGDGGGTAATMDATGSESGVVLGTLPYLSPEQVEGREADARSDLWALGVVLYEMLTGRRAFSGASAAGVMAMILEHEPPSLRSVDSLTPPSLDRLVRRCLARDPEARWQSARDVADELRWIAEGTGEAVPPGARPASRLWRLWIVAGAIVLGLASSLVGSLAGWRLLPSRLPRPSVVRSLLDVRPAEELNAGGIGSDWLPTPGGSRTALAWTPDARALVFVGRRGGVQQLYVRALDGEEARPLEGTEGAQMPVVSPDGSRVAFYANDAIRTLPLAGGPAAVIVRDIWTPFGIAWGEDGRLFYDGADWSIWSVEPERAPTVLTKRLDGEFSHLLPHPLPGGRALLYTVRRRLWTWGDEEVVAHVFATGERKVLLEDAADARYVASGHLVFLRRGTLFAVGFDASRLAVHGTPVPVLDLTVQALTADANEDNTGAGQFAVSSAGTLACLRGVVAPYPDADLVAVDREGRVTPLNAPRRSYRPFLAISPDGRRLAVATLTLEEGPLWIYDLARGTLARLPGTGEVGWQRWTPDGRRVALSWLREGRRELVWQRADGTEEPEVLARADEPSAIFFPSSWTPDGRQLALVKMSRDIWIATVEGGHAKIVPLVATPDVEIWPEFSPDGRWLAYGSNTTGRFEVYVQPYPGPGPRQQVSLEGGVSPAWSPTGRELFFLTPLDHAGQRRMMDVDVRLGATLSVGQPRGLFTVSDSRLGFLSAPLRSFAVAPDGQHFYVTRLAPSPPSPPVTQIQVVQNWLEELTARVPARR
ncbi:MAG TPA: protein kinase [Vicinamibacteria bacterium]|nr:protein kinase [Vicinamibacteria bacterium]